MSKRKQKVFELTTNSRSGFEKWYVRGVKDEESARTLGFGRFSEPKLISYYDDFPSKYGNDWKKDAFTPKAFLFNTKNFRRKFRER